ncbi:hypothetical protein [Rhizobium rosettiformans]|jgi:ABC-type anion transport system duplicated permease subunit|uniref:Uncharacterized protein n=2 Tax=Rhizobium rosettiformans TaxID=1368430 RepID=A0A4S8PUH1_9HYPH|nr:hypothetical protein [Rhizobium rosettiformans]MBA4799317.1 hypothetical protein [Hyphomicrobiales bacterium]MBB5274649.1 ABC-type anion transport system duplicated permease subunit [Rhizobium rosettiformans]MDR7028791.1 ABC-type anion transport system duplicated permease subunit [Rhizobium rosettiformans]MDR7063927.1 ABC-type anion transport system duplicated permease subunit [Rhizobium rosettiformans]THV34041.1 hypothetical protein FAA86_16425 [Rhizobium rosettiformans W3]
MKLPSALEDGTIGFLFVRDMPMARFFLRILISIVVGWMVGVQAAFAFGPEGNLTPMLYIFVTVPLTYACSFLVVPLLSGWLDRLR